MSVWRSGSVSEYSVAMPRKTTSAESARGIRTHPSCVVALSPPPWRRECQTASVATSTTSGHPTPTSTRLAPVMFASAKAHAVAPPSCGGQVPSAA